MRYVLGDQGQVIGKVENPFPRHWPESKIDEALPHVWTSIRAQFPGAVALLTLREVLKSRAFRRQIL